MGCGYNRGLRNPVPVMPLVEVIRGLRTDDATLELTLELCRAMKKDRISKYLQIPRVCIDCDTMILGPNACLVDNYPCVECER